MYTDQFITKETNLLLVQRKRKFREILKEFARQNKIILSSKQTKNENKTLIIDDQSDESDSVFEEPINKKLIQIEKGVGKNIQRQEPKHNKQSDLKIFAQHSDEEHEEDVSEDEILDKDQYQDEVEENSKTKRIKKTFNNDDDDEDDDDDDDADLRPQNNLKSKEIIKQKISQNANNSSEKLKNKIAAQKENPNETDKISTFQSLEDQLKYWHIKYKGDFIGTRSIQKDSDGYDAQVIGYKTIGNDKVPYILFLPYLTRGDKLGEDLKDQFESMISSDENKKKSEVLDRVILLPTIQEYEMILEAVSNRIPKIKSKSKQRNKNRQKKYQKIRDELNEYKQKDKSQHQ